MGDCCSAGHGPALKFTAQECLEALHDSMVTQSTNVALDAAKLACLDALVSAIVPG